jgi:hypothetical protein
MTKSLHFSRISFKKKLLRATLTGHASEITSIVVSAEHGLIVSASKDGLVLIHTSAGELLRHLVPPDSSYRCPTHLAMTREGQVLTVYDGRELQLATISGRQLKYEPNGEGDIQVKKKNYFILIMYCLVLGLVRFT